MSKSKARAVIWDMDGVIADTAPYHMKAWQEVFQKRQVAYTEEDFKRNFGKRNDTIIKNILGGNIPQSEIDSIGSEKEQRFRQKARHNLKPLPGAIELITSLKEHDFDIALASSAPVENIQLIIRELGIENYFQAIISGKEVAEGKPSPLGFLLAAEKLGVEPENCIVIEDAIAGVAAAKRAGMHCLAVTNSHPRTSLKEADLVVDTLEAVTVEGLEQFLRCQKERTSEVKMERSLVLIKPDAMQRGLAMTIIARLERQGLKLAAIKMLQMDKALAEKHYAVHRDKPFFNGLVNYIASTPIIAAVFEAEQAVEIIRKIMGPTDPAKAEAGTIRGDFGLDIERNTIHGSDSTQTAETEIKLFFAADEIFNYDRKADTQVTES